MSATVGGHDVVLAGLSDPSPAGREAFVAAVAAAFRAPDHQVRSMLERVPLTVMRVATQEEAERVRAALAGAGGLAQVVAGVPTDVVAGGPAPAPHGGAQAAAPAADETPPRGTPRPAPARPAAPAGPTTKCRECGTVQPLGQARCGTCSFPLGQPRAPRSAPSPPPFKVPAAQAPSRLDDGPGPSYVMRATAAGLMGLSLVSDLVQMVAKGQFNPITMGAMVVGAFFAWGVFQGTTWVRVLITVVGAFGAIACLAARKMFALSAAKLPPDAAAAMANMDSILLWSAVMVALFVPMLWGRGSPAKALVLGVPLAALQLYVGYVQALGKGSEALASVEASAQQRADLEAAAQKLQAQDFRGAIEAADPIIAHAREAKDDDLLAQALIIGGVAYLGAGLESTGQSMIDEAVALRPDDPQVQEFVAKMEAAKRQRDEAETQRLRGRWAPPARRPAR